MKRNGMEQMSAETGRWFDVSLGRNGRNGQISESDAAQKVRKSISYMVEHLNEPLQVATLAAMVNVSPSHYSALFKRCTGCPPIDFFIHLRMRHACQLFDSTSLNVKEVAAELGYDDPFYFSRTFKAVNRVPPSEYRLMPEDKRDSIKNARPGIVGVKRDVNLPGENAVAGE